MKTPSTFNSSFTFLEPPRKRQKRTSEPLDLSSDEKILSFVIKSFIPQQEHASVIMRMSLVCKKWCVSAKDINFWRSIQPVPSSQIPKYINFFKPLKFGIHWQEFNFDFSLENFQNVQFLDDGLIGQIGNEFYRYFWDQTQSVKMSFADKTKPIKLFLASGDKIYFLDEDAVHVFSFNGEFEYSFEHTEGKFKL